MKVCQSVIRDPLSCDPDGVSRGNGSRRALRVAFGGLSRRRGVGDVIKLASGPAAKKTGLEVRSSGDEEEVGKRCHLARKDDERTVMGGKKRRRQRA